MANHSRTPKILAYGILPLFLQASGCSSEECQDYYHSMFLEVKNSSGEIVCDSSLTTTISGDTATLEASEDCRYLIPQREGNFVITASKEGTTGSVEFSVKDDGCGHFLTPEGPERSVFEIVLK